LIADVITSTELNLNSKVSLQRKGVREGERKEKREEKDREGREGKRKGRQGGLS